MAKRFFSARRPYAADSMGSLQSVFDGSDTPVVQEPKKGRRWRRFLVIYSACFLLLGAVGCVALYRYLEDYEAARPEHVMDALMAETDADTWRAYVRSGLKDELSEFDDSEALYREYETALLQGGEFTYRNDPTAPEGETAFCVRTGGVDLCRVALEPLPGGKLSFGFHLWRVAEIAPCSALRNLQAVAVEIDALAGETVYINGKPVGESFCTGEVPCPDMEEVEQRFTRPPTFVRYRVDAMYGGITVTDTNGTELTPRSDSPAGVARYEAVPERYSVTVVAPEDVAVTLCGALLAEEDADSVSAGILTGLEKFTGEDVCRTRTYSFEGLYTLPEVTAVAADGTVLTPLLGKDDRLIYFHPNDPELYRACSDRVKQFFTNYVRYSSAPFYGDPNITMEMINAEGAEYDDRTRESMRRFWTLLDCVYWESDLYSYIRNSTDAMIWASRTQVDYDELVFSDFSWVSDHCFVCTIRYKADFSASAWYEQYTYDLQNAYEMVFVQPYAGGAWYAAGMNAVSG